MSLDRSYPYRIYNHVKIHSYWISLRVFFFHFYIPFLISSMLLINLHTWFRSSLLRCLILDCNDDKKDEYSKHYVPKKQTNSLKTFSPSYSTRHISSPKYWLTCRNHLVLSVTLVYSVEKEWCRQKFLSRLVPQQILSQRNTRDLY